MDSLVAVVNAPGDWQALRPTILLAVAMGLVLLLNELLRSLANWVRASQSELVQDHLSGLVHAKSAAVDMAFYDQPDYFDRLYRARSEAGYRPVALLQNLGSLFQNSITLVAMIVVLLPYGVWLPVALAAATLPALGIVLTYTLRQYEFRMRTTADERRTWYYDWLITAREAAAELRLFDLAPQFQAAFQAVRGRLRHERLALVADQGRAELVAGLAGILVIGAAMVWMVWQATLGLVSLGDLALVYAALNQGQGLMRGLLENVGQIYANSLFLRHLFEFLALQPTVVDAPAAAAPRDGRGAGHLLPCGQLRLPGQRTPSPARPQPHHPGRVGRGDRRDQRRGQEHPGQVALPVSMTRPPAGSSWTGSTCAICRCTTCAAASPSSSKNLSSTTPRSRPTSRWATATRRLGQTEAVATAAAASGADDVIARLPQGYETVLGTWFEGGIDLSTGEWQRIALARAFLRRAPIVVLDEPTSAMDSWAEADWLARFRTLVAGRTALIITHRFTTAMRADTIHVMDAGCIVESGSHAELLARGGRYASSWQAQVGAEQIAEYPAP